ncbi:MAG: TraB/GumN family protein [Methylophilaceae bacterium]|nr:MAG: TraB/GumN family protein [Methylophilaceae bacterium]
MIKRRFVYSFFSKFSFAIILFVASQVALASDNGLLWKLETPSGKVSYLLGTIHTDDQRVTEFSPKIIEAFNQSEAFMMETLPPRDPSIFMMKQGTVAELLTEKEFDQVRELADFHSMHIEAAMRMKPWLLAVIFDLPKPKALYSMDELLMAKAEEQYKRIVGLEKTSEHFSVLDTVSMDEQMVMLRAVLKRSQKDKERDYEKLLKTYQSGDLKKIIDLDDKITGGMLPKAVWENMRVKLIDERNAGMAEGLVSEANEKPVFAAIGASHLAGEGGVLNRLRAAGFTVTPVK